MGWLNKYAQKGITVRQDNTNIGQQRRMMDIKSGIPEYKPKHTLSQDNRTKKQYKAAVKKAKEINDASLSPFEAPLVYLANPNKMVGDFIQPIVDKSETLTNNPFPTSKEDAQRIAKNTRGLKGKLDIGLDYVPDAAINTAIGAATAGNPSLLNILNNAVNPLAGNKKKVVKNTNQYKGLKEVDYSDQTDMATAVEPELKALKEIHEEMLDDIRVGDYWKHGRNKEEALTALEEVRQKSNAIFEAAPVASNSEKYKNFVQTTYPTKTNLRGGIGERMESDMAFVERGDPYKTPGGSSGIKFDLPHARRMYGDDLLSGEFSTSYKTFKNQKEELDYLKNKTDEHLSKQFKNFFEENPNRVDYSELLTNTNRIDGNLLTRPLTPFTKDELNPGSHLYRKIGGKKGLQDLIDKGGAQAPAPMRMNSSEMLDTPFFGSGNRPNENYSGLFAVETPLPSNSKYNWSSYAGGTSNKGVAPFDPKTGKQVKNIPLEDLEVYRKKWFSNNYKKLDKDNLEAGLKNANLQNYSEKAFKWGLRGYGADQIFNEGEYTGGPALRNIPEQKDGGWLNKYESGKNISAKEGIHIKPSKKGTFTAQATKMGMGVQEAASKILSAPEGRYSPAMRKKANFAKNATKWHRNGANIIEDDRGQWAHPGKVTKINSNQITMKGVNYPVLGISDTGDRQMMQPGGEYTFKGNNVTEYPQMAQNGTELKQAPPEKGWLESASDSFSDFGTRTLNAVKTFGGSAIGDAIYGISPAAAEKVEEYTAGFIPFTHEEELIANRSGNPERWKNRTEDATEAATYGGLDILTEGMASKYLNKAKGVKSDPTIKRTLTGSSGNQTNFKSEIDWSKWNKEIPENTKLLQEYNTIEQAAKADGTWMKNPDGSAFQGTPEQFVQQNSENFKKAFPQGFEKTYRGTSSNNPKLINFDEYSAIFTGDRELASGYGGPSGGGGRLHNVNSEGFGTHELALKNSDNSIEFDAHRDDWLDLRFPTRNVKGFEKNIEANKKNLKTLQTIDPKEFAIGDLNVTINNAKKNIKALEKGLEDYKLYSKNPRYKDMVNSFYETHGEANMLGNTGIMTDDVASYLEKAKLDNIKIRNVHDGSFGDITISDQKLGNYLKSLRGNSGMFDMADPNIYKAIIPAVAGGAAASQADFKSGGWLDKYNK